MGQPAAKQNDQIVATDNHLIQPPGTAPAVMVPHPFNGLIDTALSSDVNIEGLPAATVDSIANNTPAHIPQGGSFVNPPTNQGKIIMGSGTVFINGKAAARNGDTAETCNDPKDLPVGNVVAVSTVLIGG
ncbi:PAAR domain-containing protein [Agarilytica rhodophyticola]|uniref:PAAR domain-containing protein n=1 Tax=Agarilytica rhodophyticola TaxID=1737490 RepID=UPI000B347D67|nr:PAAR domain-containing protein [Agarilytica rhodophyticola]